MLAYLAPKYPDRISFHWQSVEMKEKINVCHNDRVRHTLFSTLQREMICVALWLLTQKENDSHWTLTTYHTFAVNYLI